MSNVWRALGQLKVSEELRKLAMPFTVYGLLLLFGCHVTVMFNYAFRMDKREISDDRTIVVSYRVHQQQGSWAHPAGGLAGNAGFTEEIVDLVRLRLTEPEAALLLGTAAHSPSRRSRRAR